jgi:hypothetical protein
VLVTLKEIKAKLKSSHLSGEKTRGVGKGKGYPNYYLGPERVLVTLTETTAKLRSSHPLQGRGRRGRGGKNSNSSNQFPSPPKIRNSAV